MIANRIIVGQCGGCPVYGGVFVHALGEWYATPRNLISPLQIVASLNKAVFAANGVRKFGTRASAEAYARGKA